MIIEGNVAFSNVTKHESFNGQSTGKYSVVVTLDEGTAAALRDQGVKLKQYQDAYQRKFASKFDIRVIDANDEPVRGEIPRGSKVRLSFKVGAPHPVHGATPYLTAVRVVEFAEDSSSNEEGF